MSDQYQSPIVRVGAWIAVFVLWLSGPVPGYFMIKMFVLARASTRWPTVPGEVIRAEVGVTSTRRYFADVCYTYSVSGVPYCGTKLRVSDGEFDSPDGAGQQIQSLAPGRPVAVAYDPANPGQALLHTGAGFQEYAQLCVPPVLFTLGLGILIKLRQSRDRSRRPPLQSRRFASIDRLDLE
jgi:hypothetical protein